MSYRGPVLGLLLLLGIGWGLWDPGVDPCEPPGSPPCRVTVDFEGTRILGDQFVSQFEVDLRASRPHFVYFGYWIRYADAQGASEMEYGVFLESVAPGRRHVRRRDVVLSPPARVIDFAIEEARCRLDRPRDPSQTDSLREFFTLGPSN